MEYEEAALDVYVAGRLETPQSISGQSVICYMFSGAGRGDGVTFMRWRSMHNTARFDVACRTAETTLCASAISMGKIVGWKERGDATSGSVNHRSFRS